MSTPYQRAEILRLLDKMEFDTRTVTFMHRRCGVADQWIGRPVEAWIDSLSAEEASAVIGRMRDML